MELFWFVPIIVSIISTIAIVFLIIPLPVKVRGKLMKFFYRMIYPSFIVALILLVVFFQEFTEQRKFNARRSDPLNNNPQYTISETFRHQRNMYLTLLSIVLIGIFCILTRVLNSFIEDHNLLQEQLRARIQIDNNNAHQQHQGRPNPDGVERRNLPQ